MDKESEQNISRNMNQDRIVKMAVNQNPEREVDYTPYKKGVTVEESAESPTGFLATFIYEEQPSYEGLSGDITGVELYSDCMLLFEPVGGTMGQIRMQDAINPWKYRPGLVNAGGTKDVTYTVSMTKFAESLWGAQVPLPSGAFPYNFTVTDEAGNTRTWLEDPNNPALCDPISGQHSLSSMVYMPYDRSKMGASVYADRTMENPCPDPESRGRIEFLSYDSVSRGENRNLAVYLPVGYDPERTEPYPVLYLSHGTTGNPKGNELRWFNEGAAVNISDNLIAAGKAVPFVIVCMNNQDLPGGDGEEWNYEAIEEEQFSCIMPLIESTYHVSHEPDGRAYAGLSRGGAAAQHMLEDHGDAFSYYGIWSYATRIRPDQIRSLTHPVHILLNAGKWDFGYPSILDYCAGLDEIGVPYTFREFPAAHDWEEWKLVFAFAAENLFK